MLLESVLNPFQTRANRGYPRPEFKKNRFQTRSRLQLTRDSLGMNPFQKSSRLDLQWGLFSVMTAHVQRQIMWFVLWCSMTPQHLLAHACHVTWGRGEVQAGPAGTSPQGNRSLFPVELPAGPQKSTPHKLYLGPAWINPGWRSSGIGLKLILHDSPRRKTSKSRNLNHTGSCHRLSHHPILYFSRPFLHN